MALGSRGVIAGRAADFKWERRQRVPAESTFVEVAVRNEEDPLAAWIRPLAWIFAAVGVCRGHDWVGGLAELLGVGLVAAD
jgi:hypothetical protein